MEKLLEIGLSGWIGTIITILLGGCIALRQMIKRRSRQINIKAGGDVAGGDIIKGKHKVANTNGSSKKVTYSVQENIDAKSDVAGGNIIKGDG